MKKWSKSVGGLNAWVYQLFFLKKDREIQIALVVVTWRAIYFPKIFTGMSWGVPFFLSFTQLVLDASNQHYQ